MPEKFLIHSSHKSSERNLSGPIAYPFSGIVGQEEMKLALLLSVVDPSLGGVLIMGHRGTAKSTAVRGLADLLPNIRVVSGCVLNCNPGDERELCSDCRSKLSQGKLQSRNIPVPVVDLPLGATEDRVCGTIDIERALTRGQRTFEPGLLARANRGLLYIDEVNLLDDHLVDLLLDVSVTGRNKVEREGISVEHASRFILIGSGNPEEGELRPQLLDRFGLHVDVSTETDVDRRIEIVERRELFDHNAAKFHESVKEEQQRLKREIAQAQRRLRSVKIDAQLVRKVVELCLNLKIDGHRGELTITRAARALAALQNRRKVTEADIRKVTPISLRHRLRRGPFDETGGTQQIHQELDRVFGKVASDRSKDPGDSDDHAGNGQPAQLTSAKGASGSSTTQALNSTPDGSKSEIDLDFESALQGGNPSSASRHQGSRRRPNSRSTPNHARGRYSRAVLSRPHSSKVAVDATLRALLQSRTESSSGQSTELRFDVAHLRYKQFTRKAGFLFVLAVDTSGSMARERIERARRVVMVILHRAYLRRDAVALITFRALGAELALPPSQSVLRAKRTLDALATGGGTPLSAGISEALHVVKRSNERNSVVLLFTDGGANVPMTTSYGPEDRESMIAAELTSLGVALRRANVNAFVLDTRNRFTGNGQARKVSEKLGAEYVRV